jgi:ABC-2 type transport system permease protein
MIRLIEIEVRRMLARRLLRVVALLVTTAILLAAILSAIYARDFVYVTMTDVFQFTIFWLCLISLILGASFVGAEWHHGTIGTLLTWQPRRARLLGSKAAAAMIVAFVGTWLAQAVLAAALIPAAKLHGTTAGVDAAWLARAGGIVLRGAVLVSIAAAIGLAIASIGRNTAAALGVAFGYFAIAEPFLRAWRPGWDRWLAGGNIAVYLPIDSNAAARTGRSVLSAGVVLVAYGAILMAAAIAVFRRRDVT